MLLFFFLSLLLLLFIYYLYYPPSSSSIFLLLFVRRLGTHLRFKIVMTNVLNAEIWNRNKSVVAQLNLKFHLCWDMTTVEMTNVNKVVKSMLTSPFQSQTPQIKRNGSWIWKKVFCMKEKRTCTIHQIAVNVFTWIYAVGKYGLNTKQKVDEKWFITTTAPVGRHV